MASALTDLRRTRRSRRLGDSEWFDLAYRVYLAAFFGGGAIIVASEQVGDRPLDAGGIADVFRYGPGFLGIAAALALAIGIMGGAEGGPLSIESADVTYLLMAPISRASVLHRPYFQRLRSELFMLTLVGASAGLLAAQRLPGRPPSWVLSGAGFGACLAALHVGGATVTHAIRLPKWAAAGVATAIVVGQALALAQDRTGPFDHFGSLALWGDRQVVGDTLAIVTAVAIAIAGWAVVGRLRIEQLARRGPLVSQLRFAVTTQDLRTVVLLRRQLRQEQPRPRPWISLAPRGGGPTGAVLRRSVRSMLRMPINRMVRLGALAGAAGIAAGAAAAGTTPAVLGTGFALFVLGLDLIEPLSQEIDHPDLTESFPVDVGWLHVRLLFGPALFAVPLAAIGAAACSVVAPASAGAAFVLAVPITLIGMGGAIVNVFQGTGNSSGADISMVPPEVSGFGNLFKAALPVVVSTLGTVSIIAVTALPTTGTVVRSLVALVLVCAAMFWWVNRRAQLSAGWNNMLADAKQQNQAKTASRGTA